MPAFRYVDVNVLLKAFFVSCSDSQSILSALNCYLMPNALRNTVIRLKVFQLLRSCVTSMAVHQTVKRHGDLGILKDHLGVEDPGSSTLFAFKNIIRNTMSKTTSDLNIGPVSVRRIVKCELGTYSYKIRQVHMLMEKLTRKLLSIVWQSLTSNVDSQHDIRRSETVDNLFEVDIKGLRKHLSNFPSSVMVCSEWLCRVKLRWCSSRRISKLTRNSIERSGSLGLKTSGITELDIPTGLRISRNIWPSNSPDLNPMDFNILTQFLMKKLHNKSLCDCKRRKQWAPIKLNFCLVFHFHVESSSYHEIMRLQTRIRTLGEHVRKFIKDYIKSADYRTLTQYKQSTTMISSWSQTR
uniref:Ras-GEF domain-containing protein n=1 Tax=Heterorhabditis bacteriophora TaxID=37862 RepID=A0A1I7W9C9_HETBA